MKPDDEITYKLVSSEDGKSIYLKIESTSQMSNADFVLALEAYLCDLTRALNQHKESDSTH